MKVTKELIREIMIEADALRPRRRISQITTTPPMPKPTGAGSPVVRLATARELSVEAQRERVGRDLRELSRAEREAAEAGRYVMGSPLYYEVQERALADAKRWAMFGRSDGKVERAYDPIARFEHEGNE